MRFHPTKSSFNGGQLSPLMDGQTQFEKYASGCNILSNVIPTVQGPATRRPGTRYVDNVYNQTAPTWLFKFEFNFAQSFILEFSPNIIKFYYQQGVLLGTNGKPYTIATPYTATDLQDVTYPNLCGLHIVQSNDTLYVTCRTKPVQKIFRVDNNTWTINPVNFRGIVYDATFNPDQTQTVWVDTSGNNQLHCSVANMFNPNNGATFDTTKCYLFLNSSVIDNIPQWQNDTAYAVDAIVQSNGYNYKCTVAGTSGFVSPIHTQGTNTDGSKGDNGITGCTWLYLDDNTLEVKITGQINPTTYTYTINNSATGQQYSVPAGMSTAPQATFSWSLNAWNNTDGYPTHAIFYRERLCFARDDTLWFSKSSDYQNFYYMDYGQVTDDNAIQIEVSCENATIITHMIETPQGLIVGTLNGEVLITSENQSAPFSPTNAQVFASSGYGSLPLDALRVEAAILFIQRNGRKLRESQYQYMLQEFVAVDTTIISENITFPGIVSIVFQREPYNIIWMVRKDGILIGFTYCPDQNVKAWHQHQIGGYYTDPNTGLTGPAKVMSIQVISNPTGTADDLWMVVKRTINGQTVQTVEWLEQGYQTGDPLSSAFYVDCGNTYSGKRTNVITGLGYLNGQKVDVLADGIVMPQCVVTNGQITLPEGYMASVVQVGLPYTPMMQTMRLDGGSQTGTAQGMIKKINAVIIRVLNTLGIMVGPTVNGPWAFTEFNERSLDTPMDQANPLVTGDTLITTWPDGYSRDCYVTITQNQPLPMTITAIMPTVSTYEN